MLCCCFDLNFYENKLKTEAEINNREVPAETWINNDTV